MVDVSIRYHSNVYVQVDADRHILVGMNEHFARFVKGYQFTPKFKARVWDGKIRFLQYSNGLIYAGLIKDVLDYCKANGHTFEVEPNVKRMFGLPVDDLDGYLDALNLSAHGSPIEFRDYQRDAIRTCLQQKRRLVQSPTSSGKSSMIYGICRYLTDRVLDEDKGVLIVVPTIGLVTQMVNDFKDYSSLNGWGVEGMVSMSTDKKGGIKTIHVTTWQSIFRLPPEWFERFDALIVDEAHQAKAASLVQIGKTCNASFRYGFSGSIDSEDETTEMTLRGLFGFKYVATTTKDLMDRKEVATATVHCVHLTYDYPYNIPSKDYQKEIEWMVSQQPRNRFLLDLADNADGNVLILFSLVEKHGKVLKEMAKGLKKEVFFVYGGVDVDERERIRKLAETHKGCIILASYQTFSTGISIRNLHHIMFGSPTKSFSRVVQSIGRGLRTSKTKTECTIWDLFDEIYGDGANPSSYNYTFKHFLERAKIYIKEGFKYNIEKVGLTK